MAQPTDTREGRQMDESITFHEPGRQTCVGWLYLPDDIVGRPEGPGHRHGQRHHRGEGDGRCPAYAERFAAAGYRRPLRSTSDTWVKAAASHGRRPSPARSASTTCATPSAGCSAQPEIDANRIGAWGASFGGRARPRTWRRSTSGSRRPSRRSPRCARSTRWSTSWGARDSARCSGSSAGDRTAGITQRVR